MRARLAPEVIEQVPQRAGSFRADRVLQLGQDGPRVACQVPTGGREDDEPAAGSRGVVHRLQQAVPDQAADQLLSGLTAGAEPSREGGWWEAVGGEMGEDEGLGRGQPRPPVVLEPLEELPVEPPAGTQQQQREWLSWHSVRLPDTIGSGYRDREVAMRVVVLGAGGGVGRQVRNAAVPLGRQVVAAARSTPSVPVEVEAVAVDVRDAAGVTATPVAEADVEADVALATLDLAGSRRSLLLVAG